MNYLNYINYMKIKKNLNYNYKWKEKNYINIANYARILN